MKKLMIIDNERCEEELNEFVSKHRNDVMLIADIHHEKGKIIRVLQELLGNQPAEQKLLLNSTDGVFVLSIDAIIRAELIGEKVIVYYNEDTLIIDESFDALEELLHPYRVFLKIHPYHIVNVHYIKQFSMRTGQTIIMENDVMLPAPLIDEQTILDISHNL